MTPEQLAQLREKAEKATPGPWVKHKSYPKCIYTKATIPAGEITDEVLPYSRIRDLEFIASANPAIILALLDTVERYMVGLQDAIEGMETMVDDLNNCHDNGCVPTRQECASALVYLGEARQALKGDV